VDIENLIKKNSTINANDDTSAMIEKQLLENSNEEIHESSVDNANEQAGEEAIQETESDNDELHDKDERPWRAKLKHLQQELVDNLHAPSAAAGAAASATVCVIVGLLLSRR
jgi:hypothetical protein